MARPKRPKTTAAEIQGLKYFSLIQPVLERLHDVGTARDKAGNRGLFFDDFAALLLLYFFSPVVTSMRGLLEATDLAKVQELLGISHISLGSFSEATTIFDAQALREIVAELAARAMPLSRGQPAEMLRGLTAVDGTILRALPKMAWALWQGDHRAAKLHLHFDVFRGVPCDGELTPAAYSEIDVLERTLQASRLYVLDRGYASYPLMRKILDAQSSFVVRVKDSTVFKVAEERSLTPDDQAAGVCSDRVLKKLGTDHHKDELKQPVRLVVVRRQNRDGKTEELWLVTDRLDLPAWMVALAYHYRWTVELFFRWMKCILGCRHLLFTDPEGVAIQVYVALIASLLIVLWTGRKPTKRTWEMVQFYLLGWASLDELERHLKSLPQQNA